MDRTIDEIYTEVYQIFNNQIDINDINIIIKKDVNMILEEFLKQSLIIKH